MLTSPAWTRRPGCRGLLSIMAGKTSSSSNDSAKTLHLGLEPHSPLLSDYQSDSASSSEVHDPPPMPYARAMQGGERWAIPFFPGLARGEGESPCVTDSGFSSVHGGSTDDIKAMDLILESFLSPMELQRAQRLAAFGVQQLAEPEIVLITCGDDFLGRFLLLEVLQRIAARERGHVFALVHARDSAEAASKLASSYESGDPELSLLFCTLSTGRLSVLHGDISKPRFGLSLGMYMTLSASVDTILHNAAVHDYTASYKQLYQPNVLGTIEVIRLALTCRIKAVMFISSVAVIAGVPHPEPVLEAEDATALCTEHPSEGGYAVGFGCSKWAGELLLQQAHNYFDVPLLTFRCGMLLPHTRFVGQMDPTGFFSRFLYGIAYTGIAPESFYSAPQLDVHFDGTSVDFAAAAITAVAWHEREGFATYHVVNDHWGDRVSLDVVADWLALAGIQVRRIPSYKQWYAEFKAALACLDAARRCASPWPIIQHWRSPLPGERVTKFVAAKLRDRLKKYTRWTEMPHLDEKYVRHSLCHLAAHGLLTLPHL